MVLGVARDVSGPSVATDTSIVSASRDFSPFDSDQLVRAVLASSALSHLFQVSPASAGGDAGLRTDCTESSVDGSLAGCTVGRSGFGRVGLLVDCGVSSTSVSRIRLFISVHRSQRSQVK